MLDLLTLAADGGPTDFKPLTAITALVVFLVAFAILALKVWPIITKALDERNEKIVSEIRGAEEAREQAKAALADYERSLAEAREEAQKMIADAKAEATRLGEELKAKNERELQERVTRANADIEAARTAAVGDLHAHAADLAAAMAGRILGRAVTADDQQRLVEESLQDLRSSRN